jgi:HSP20 family protein
MLMPFKKNEFLSPAEVVRKEFERLFDEEFTSLDNGGNLMPQIDAYEEDDKYIVNAALPGVEKDKINIEVNENSLTLSGENSYKKEVDEKNLYRNEIRHGKFVRSFSFDKNIDADKVKANYKDGILKIDLPKKEDTRTNTRKIKVS